MKNFKIIDQYVNKELSESDKLTFEGKLAGDQLIKAEFDSYMLSKKLIALMIRHEMKQNLSKLDVIMESVGHSSDDATLNDYNKIRSISGSQTSINRSGIDKIERDRKSPLTKWKNLLMASVGVLGLLIVGFWFVSYQNNYSGITEAHLSFVEISMTRGSENRVLEQIRALEIDKNYKEAVSMMQRQIAMQPESESFFAFYIAQDYFRLKEFDEANAYSDIVINDRSSQFYEEASLLKVFIAIENKSLILAKTLINQLENDPNFTMQDKLSEIKAKLDD